MSYKEDSIGDKLDAQLIEFDLRLFNHYKWIKELRKKLEHLEETQNATA